MYDYNQLGVLMTLRDLKGRQVQEDLNVELELGKI